MLNMKHVTFSKGSNTIGYLVTPTGCKPISRGTIARTKWIDTKYAMQMLGSSTLGHLERFQYLGWRKDVVIL